ncbi:hypothetical protein [Cedecea colo]|uniref:Uncharacterized protein n=1 Tax=Cedecea colo TaxID=2552946 RepID=A0ABX0VKZ5_9ENTR|nr:hypothetical protein [Cedecea colo]NIY47250.1 hypothetical protein [Cedecea colo]
MMRRVHPNKDIEAALSYAEHQGWQIKAGGSHCWGKMYCPWNNKICRCGEFCISCIWSTPRNAWNHARQIRRVVDGCCQNTARPTRH